MPNHELAPQDYAGGRSSFSHGLSVEYPLGQEPHIINAIHEIRPGNGGISPDIYKPTFDLVNAAQADAFERSDKKPDTLQRIHNGIERRFLPYVLENETIAAQLETERYQQFAQETASFLDAKVGFFLCPDGRILPFLLFDPRVASMYRKLQGLPETRPSTKYGSYVLNDPDLSAAVKTDTELRIESGENAELVELGGPHIHSLSPDHGCGAGIGKMKAKGRTPEIGMKHGGIKEYYDELGEGFYAFNNAVGESGGTGTTFDLVHDAYSQGFIVGLREGHKEFLQELSLRENLLRLAEQRKILMTELLDDRYRQDIIDMSARMGVVYPLDINDYNQFGSNAITIGTVARELSLREQENGFDFIPNRIRDDSTPTALRVLGYHALRNVVARVLGDERAGARSRHPEKLIRIGPIGADFNIQNIPFIQNVPFGRTRPEDIEGLRALHDLSYNVMREQGIDLTQEGRVILATGSYDEGRYANRRAALEELNERKGMVQNNAAWYRLNFEDSVATGETIVLGCLYTPSSRRITHIF